MKLQNGRSQPLIRAEGESNFGFTFGSHVLASEPVEKVPFRFAIPAHLLRVITAREG
jgi:hypothetical protein